jgi:acetoin utilization deacetylase AcuC-like enzyme
VSVYGNDYWDNKPFRDVSVKQHQDGVNHLSFALPSGCDRATMLDVMSRALPAIMSCGRPDVILYQAGADPFREDPYSPLNLDHNDLLERDRVVFDFAKQQNIPIAWVLAGGYTQDTSQVVRVHVNTFEAWRAVFG